MTWLIDTRTLLWSLYEPGKLGRKTRAILEEPANDVRVSPLSYWEISLKFGLGKLLLPATDPSEIPAAVGQLSLSEDPLAPEILSTFHQLPHSPNHRDPFDRLMIWQAIRRKHTLLSKDRNLPFYQAHGLSFEW